MENLVTKNYWQDKRVFITGASGFLGGWLVKELFRLQANVVVLLRDWTPNSQLLKDNLSRQVDVVHGDLGDPLLLERILAEYEVETIFHLAAQTIVTIANNNPLSTFRSNIEGTWNLLEACRRCSKKIKQIVVASSDKAYGDVPNLPYKEDTPLSAIYPYDVSKACADMLAVSYAKTWNLPITVTRCGNFFGGGDLNWNRIIPGTIRRIIRGQKPLIRSNGQMIRDYVYIEDAVNAYLTLAEKMSEKPEIIGEVFNFAAGHPLSVLQVTEKIMQHMGYTDSPLILNETSGEIEAQYLDSTKSKELLNWNAKFGIEQGLINTINWYRLFFQRNSDEMSKLCE